MVELKVSGEPFWRHPAGLFFALSAVLAVALPWVAAFGGAAAHLHLALFGFGGAAVTGYVLTALPAWSHAPRPIPALLLACGFVAARLWVLAVPGMVLPAVLIHVATGLWIIRAVLPLKSLSRLPIAMAPLVLAGAEALVALGWIRPDAVFCVMAALILFVGGRAVPAFLVTEALRQGRNPAVLPLLGPAFLCFAVMLVSGWIGWIAAVGYVVCILALVQPALQAGAANRMLAGAWATLALTVPLLVLVSEGNAGMQHLFLIATMGGTIFAFASRAAMVRSDTGGLAPHPLQLAGFALILLAAPLRMASPVLGITISGLAWSLGWLAFLACHIRAMARQTPFPVLSATREAPRSQE